MNKNGMDIPVQGVQVNASVISRAEGLAAMLRNPAGSYAVFPGFCDVHVHFREPGFSYKETILTGSQAAAHGGYTTVCAMPNLNPVADTAAHLQQQIDIIRRDASVEVLPYAAISMEQKGEELVDMEALAPLCVAFSDDGHGVQSESRMREAMERAKSLNRLIVAHCEDNSLLRGGYIHNGCYAAVHGHRGICSESEWGPIARDVRLSKETGCGYHVCHISCKESVAIIREAKRQGVNVTCETAPHYLTLDDSCLQEEGRFKMNPPLRDASDREALIEGLLDGTIDAIATDHAPHSAAEKAKGLAGSAFGIVGLETAFPELYTRLVKPGIVPLERIIEALTTSPRRRFGIAEKDDFTLWELANPYTVNPEDFLTMGRATPFAGDTVYGRCLATVCGGRLVYADPALNTNTADR